VFWAPIGGLDPLKLLPELQGSITQVHLKDLLAGTGVITNEVQVPPTAFKELGAGVIDIRAIMRTAHAAGVQYCHVEHDHVPAPLQGIGESIEYLKERVASRPWRSKVTGDQLEQFAGTHATLLRNALERGVGIRLNTVLLQDLCDSIEGNTDIVANAF